MAYGSVATDQIVTSVANTSLGAGNSSIMKNRIINGAMVIDQRNAGASVTPTVDGQYTLDRWQVSLSAASKFSVQQNGGGVITAPAGFNNYLSITSLSAYSVPTGGYFMLNQPIEGFNVSDLNWGTANAKTITLSFQVFSSLTGTFGGAIQNSAQNRAYPFSYSIPVANTWTTISVTIAGDTTGTWVGSTNGVGMFVRFGLGVGSNFSTTAGSWTAGQYFSSTGATSVVGTSGATFLVTGVQLEVGSSATGYEYRQYQQELALCQRYFWMCTRGNGSTDQMIANGFAYSASQPEAVIQMKTSMRTAPSLYISNVANTFQAGAAAANYTFGTMGIYGSSTESALVYGSGVGGFTAGQGVRISIISTATSTAYIGFSAEL